MLPTVPASPRSLILLRYSGVSGEEARPLEGGDDREKEQQRRQSSMTAPAGDPHRYDDMIGLPHHASRTHPPMARSKRAAQFAPFAALTGYEAAISEAARETEEKKELSEDQIEMIEARLAVIAQHIREQPEITVT